MTQVHKGFHALVVGVGEYLSPRFADLPATKADAREIASILRDPRLCGYDPGQVEVLLGPEATVPNMRILAERLAGVASRDSTVLLFFSGHGGRLLVENAWRSYLCFRETDPYQLAGSALSGEEFSGMLRAIRSERLVVVLDSCYAAGAAQFKAPGVTLPWKSGFQDSFYEFLSRGAGRVVLASSAEDQVSRVRSDGELSLFTYHLIAALRGGAAVRGDGFVHVLDVFHYVSDAVQKDDPEQTPILKAESMNANFPIAHALETMPALPPAPTSAEPPPHQPPQATTGQAPPPSKFSIGSIHGETVKIYQAETMDFRAGRRSEQNETGKSE